MKLLSQLTMLAVMVITLNACSNDFLDEVPAGIALPFGESAIYISPEWDEDDYWFTCPIALSAEFSIEETPDWLQIDNKTGNLTIASSSWLEPTPRNKGTIRAKATANPEFAKVGIYIDYMTVKVNNNSYRVPVYYITEGNPKIVVNTKLEFSYTSLATLRLTFGNDGEGLLLWDLVSISDWLKLDTMNVSAGGAVLARYAFYSIPLKFDLETDLSVNEYEGDIVLRTNDKDNQFVTVHVTADLGNPVCNLSGVYNNQIDFSANQYSASVSLYNQGYGLLNWQFSDLPDWLTLNKTSGSTSSYNSVSLGFYINANKLVSGSNTATIKLKTNDPAMREVSIVVTARGEGNNALTYPIEGNIVDAMFVKSLNTLVYATSQPNKLLFYDAGTKTIIHEIALSKAPTCFTFSEDYSTAAVGHGGLISAIDLSNYTVSKTFEVSNNVYDIAWADSSLYCYTEQAYNSDYIFWFDINDGSKTTLTSNQVDGKTRIKKVPTQPYMIASRQQTSPSGFFSYSVESHDILSYDHKDLGDYWFTEDGEYTFSRDGYVYRTSTATQLMYPTLATINPIDNLDNGRGTRYIPLWVDHSSVTNKLFLINSNYNNQYMIYQLDDVDYLLEDSFLYDKYYQLDISTSIFEVDAHYVFANREGTELLVLRKGKENNYWSLEYIER